MVLLIVELCRFTARLDGTNRLMEKRKTASMADYLQLDDWEPPKRGADGKKRVSVAIIYPIIFIYNI